MTPEPNLTTLGWPAQQASDSRTRRILTLIGGCHWSAWVGALCLALMFGLMWAGDATPAVYAIVGLGAALMAAVCVITES